MSEPDRQFDALRPLLMRLVDETLDDADRARLAGLLREDPAARSFYLQYMLTDAMLRLEHSTPLGPTTERKGGKEATARVPVSILHSLVGVVPLSYAIAVLIMIGGILAVGTWKAPEAPMHAARNFVPLQTPPAAARQELSKPTYVAKITKMDGCTWQDPKSAAEDGLSVRLGRAYFLGHGQVEISYDTGAKVVVKGPVLYEVDSPSGGIVWSGAATVYVEEKPARDGGRSGSQSNAPIVSSATATSLPNAQEIIRSPLFTLRTTLAVLSSRGGEFGVSTDKSGAFFAHVNRGSVALQMPGWDAEKAVTLWPDRSAVALVMPNSDGFHWELRLSGDEPVMVDAGRPAPKLPPVVLQGGERRHKAGQREEQWQQYLPQ